MALLVVVIGALIAAAGVWGVLRPQGLIALVGRWQGRLRLHVAVAIRLLLGAVLVVASPACRWPGVVAVIGYITLAAALGLLVMGPDRLDAFVAWWQQRSKTFVRGWSLLAVGFGALLAYAAGW